MALEGRDYGVKKFFIHPDYERKTLFNDIAMLVVENRIEFDDYVQPVCLPDSGMESLVSIL